MKEINMTEETADMIAEVFHHFGNSVKEITLREEDNGEITVVVTIRILEDS